MATLGADGLNLLVGDGATSEIFSPLKGNAFTRLAITQRGHVANAVTNQDWQALVGTSGRHVVLECECYATDEPAALRIRALGLTGAAGNVKLQLRSAETLLMRAYVMEYREDNTAGDIKRMRFRLESTGVASLA